MEEEGQGMRFLGLLSLLGLFGLIAVALEALSSTPTPSQIERGGEAAAILRGRQVYIAEGCIHCHSQYVRPGTHDEAWWGPSHPLDRAEAPPLAGSRRQGPDLLEVGNRRNALWHELHLRDPRSLNPGSRMPSYAHLFAGPLSGQGQRGRDLVAYLAALGEADGAERWELTVPGPADRTERIEPPAPPSAARGAALFATYCAVCHGREGRGDGRYAAQIGDPYLNLRKPGFHSISAGAPVDRALARIVQFGLPPTAMPGHEWLDRRQIADLVAYVQTLPTREEAAR
jgi:cbb3-type cytochrome oxidase cytochrome c subunit